MDIFSRNFAVAQAAHVMVCGTMVLIGLTMDRDLCGFTRTCGQSDQRCLIARTAW